MYLELVSIDAQTKNNAVATTVHQKPLWALSEKMKKVRENE